MSNDSKVNQWFQLCVGNWLVSGPGSCSMEKKTSSLCYYSRSMCMWEGWGGGGGWRMKRGYAGPDLPSPTQSEEN